MILAWQYGLLPPLTGGCDPALFWGADCEREMALQVELWNALVGIENERRAGERRVLVADDPMLGAKWDAFDRVLEEIAALPRRAPPGVDPDAWRARVAALRAERHDRWVELKPLIAASRKEKRPELRVLADVRFEHVKIARNGSGLWWGNYNAVCAAFEVALGRLGPGQQLHPHKWDGAGRLTNQLMGGFPAASLTAGGHAQVRLENMPPDHPLCRRGAGAKGRLKLLVATVYSSGRGTRRLAAWPIVLHRPFPPGAMVKTVTISKRRIARVVPPDRWDWRWTAAFSCECPDPPASTSNLACGIDIGWRQVEDGVRVATVVGQGDMVARHIVVPRAWLERRVRLAELTGYARMQDDNALAGPAGEADRREARWARRAAAHGLDEADGERREFYRIVAKAITERYGLLAIDGAGLAQMARRRRAGEPGEDLPPATRRMRTWTAPGELVRELERAARARGCRVELASGKTTLTCHRCGELTDPADRAELIWRCRCGAAWDQDENAARNVLAAALGNLRPPAAAASAIEIGPRQSKGLQRSRGDRRKSARKTVDNPVKSAPPGPGP